MPMGFCYPGKGKNGDLPPRPECAPEWHPKLLENMNGIRITLLTGLYAQKYYLGNQFKKSLSENILNNKNTLPKYFSLVHPSPLNFRWRAKNKWFDLETLPHLRKLVKAIIQGTY